MAKLVMSKQDSKFGAPQGTYVAEYVGTVEKTHPEYGPGLEWQFKITDGIYKGKIISRTTAMTPTTKNSCGSMLKQLAGGVVEIGQEVDEAQFIGRMYSVMVGPNSTGNGTRIETVMPTQATPAKASGRPAPPPPPPDGDGSQPAPAVPAAPVSDRVFWAILGAGQEAKEYQEAEISEWMIKNKVSSHTVKVMTQDQSSGWKTAHHFQIPDNIPF